LLSGVIFSVTLGRETLKSGDDKINVRTRFENDARDKHYYIRSNKDISNENNRNLDLPLPLLSNVIKIPQETATASSKVLQTA
jgi:hypothetical protein